MSTPAFSIPAAIGDFALTVDPRRRSSGLDRNDPLSLQG